MLLSFSKFACFLRNSLNSSPGWGKVGGFWGRGGKQSSLIEYKVGTVENLQSNSLGESVNFHCHTTKILQIPPPLRNNEDRSLNLSRCFVLKSSLKYRCWKGEAKVHPKWMLLQKNNYYLGCFKLATKLLPSQMRYAPILKTS